MNLPLVILLAHHPDSADAACLADRLHQALNDDPAVPGLRVPTRRIPEDGSKLPPTPALPSEADDTIVVLLADDYLAAAAQEPRGSGRTWGQYVIGLRDVCTASKAHFMPVQVSENGRPIHPALDILNWLQAWSLKDLPARSALVARRLIHLAIRRLDAQGTSDAPPVTIFLSHAKTDLETEPRAVRALLGHLTATQPTATWFDSGDIEIGSHFADEIRRGVSDAALMAVVTDSYCSRAWCRREVLLAKHFQRPVVVVDALRDGEVRRFPYGGNVPVVRWNGDPEHVVDVLLREALRHSYAAASLRKRAMPEDTILCSGPELVTLVRCDKDHPVLYPDPPLGPEELAVLTPLGVQITTPLERYARQHDLSSRNLLVAMSVSEAEDVARFGLRSTHLDEVFLEISRYLLISGVRLAYGGHLLRGGYTMHLAGLLRDPALEYLRGGIPAGAPPDPQLIAYIPWPTFASIESRAQLGPHVEIRPCRRPDGVTEALDPALTEVIEAELLPDSPVRQFARARGLTAMREQQIADVSARILIGGALGTRRPYRGRMPGVLEEAFLTIAQRRPIFILGAFGGCAQLVVDALHGEQRPELTWAHHRQIEGVESLEVEYRRYHAEWPDYDAIAEHLARRGMGGLANGLTADENEELAQTRSPERMIELIIRGLHDVCIAAAEGGD